MEWSAIGRRLANSRDHGRAAAEAIVPALWTPMKPENLPEVARDIQYDDPSFGPRYATHGFFGLIKLSRYREDYEVAVYELARRIVAVAQRASIRPEPPLDYDSLESAFGAGKQVQSGRRQLRITVLALDNATLPIGRAREYYGESARLWRPYHPDSEQPLAEYAASLTRRAGCQPAVGTFDEHAAHWDGGNGPVPPGICLIDPWATLSAVHAKQLQRLDDIHLSWVGVVIPWNSQDAELSAAEQALRESLGRQLNRKLASVPSRCRLAADGIPTLEEFRIVWPQMITIMLARFRHEAPAHPPAGPPIERPRLRRVDPADSGEDDG
jgi:FxsC-like protein